MKLRDKIATLFRAQRRRPTSQPGRERREEPPPERRPTPADDPSSPLDPVHAWGIPLEPADKAVALTSDLIEQLALEAFLNGPAFEFTDAELELRFLAFIDRMVEAGELSRRDPLPGRHDPSPWIKAQGTRINRLAGWWRRQGGPDIAAKVL
jgi:hypothetical protein